MQLYIKNISKTFKNSDGNVTILNNISLEIKSGDIITIYGHSGVGKSTLLNIIGGIIKPDNGDILINNTNIRNIIKNGEISYLFQKNNLLEEFTIKENLLLPLIIKGYSYINALNIINPFLAKVGMELYINRYPIQLSIGENQRIALLRCFVNSPKLVIADEPTANLDENNCKQLLELLVKLNKEFKITYVIASHDIRFRKISTKVYKLFNGELNKNE